MKIGCHVSNSGEEMLVGAVKEAVSYDANCMMIYLGAPQNTYRKSIPQLRIEEYQQLLQTHHINPHDVIVHAPYIINLAQADEDKRQYAVRFLTQEVLTTEAIGARYVVVHPGAFLNLTPEIGLMRIVQSLQEVLNQTNETNVILALETMAGKGSECCFQFSQLREIMNQINSPRIKVCFDTCHTFDSGYDWVHHYESVLDEMNSIIGLDNIAVIHLNDSKNPLGSKKDRHENIGFGQIGFDTLSRIAHDERLMHIVKILETPYIENQNGEKEFPPYAFEIAMLKNNQFNPQLKEEIKLANEHKKALI